jgi:carbonic anhydrase
VSVTDQLLENSKSYAERFEKGDLPLAPAMKVAVLACMDARLIPTRVLGLDEGDAHVIRNAGGVVTDDEIRSLAISQRKLGTQEVLLIHHTECGLLGLSDEDFRRELKEETGVEPSWHSGAFSDLEQDVRDSIDRIRSSPFIPNKDSIRGFVYDVRTGALTEVKP